MNKLKNFIYLYIKFKNKISKDTNKCVLKDENKCVSKDENKCVSKDENKCISKDTNKCISKDTNKCVSKDENKNGIIKYCIHDAYQKVIKLPFYKNPIFVYSDFQNSNIQKIKIEINNYRYFILNITYKKDAYLYDTSSEEDSESEENIYHVKRILDMNDEKILKKNILSAYELKKYEYMKKSQKYLYYSIHIGFYILYLYYFINIILGISIDIKNICMIHFFHLSSEILILHLL